MWRFIGVEGMTGGTVTRNEYVAIAMGGGAITQRCRGAETATRRVTAALVGGRRINTRKGRVYPNNHHKALQNSMHGYALLGHVSQRRVLTLSSHSKSKGCLSRLEPTETSAAL